MPENIFRLVKHRYNLSNAKPLPWEAVRNCSVGLGLLGFGVFDPFEGSFKLCWGSSSPRDPTPMAAGALGFGRQGRGGAGPA